MRAAAKILDGRGKAGRHGAIWEVIPAFEILLDQFEKTKERLAEATTRDYPDQPAMEDHSLSCVFAGAVTDGN